MDKKDYTLADAARDYWDLTQRVRLSLDFLQSRIYGTPYGIDSRRGEAHDILCEKLGLAKEATKEITDNMDRFDCFESFYDSLLKLKTGGKH